MDTRILRGCCVVDGEISRRDHACTVSALKAACADSRFLHNDEAGDVQPHGEIGQPSDML